MEYNQSLSGDSHRNRSQHLRLSARLGENAVKHRCADSSNGGESNLLSRDKDLLDPRALGQEIVSRKSRPRKHFGDSGLIIRLFSNQILQAWRICHLNPRIVLRTGVWNSKNSAMAHGRKSAVSRT